MLLSSTAGVRPVELRLHQGRARWSARSGRSCRTARMSPSLTTRAPAFSAAVVSASFRLRAVRRRTQEAGVQHAGKQEIAGVLAPCR